VQRHRHRVQVVVEQVCAGVQLPSTTNTRTTATHFIHNPFWSECQSGDHETVANPAAMVGLGGVAAAIP
jgi:hypothetical protein